MVYTIVQYLSHSVTRPLARGREGRGSCYGGTCGGRVRRTVAERCRVTSTRLIRPHSRIARAQVGHQVKRNRPSPAPFRHPFARLRNLSTTAHHLFSVATASSFPDSACHRLLPTWFKIARLPQKATGVPCTSHARPHARGGGGHKTCYYHSHTLFCADSFWRGKQAVKFSAQHGADGFRTAFTGRRA